MPAHSLPPYTRPPPTSPSRRSSTSSLASHISFRRATRVCPRRPLKELHAILYNIRVLSIYSRKEKCPLLPPRRRRMRATTSSTPSTATWTVVGAPALMARACTTTKVPLRTRRSCVRFTRGSLRLSDGRLSPRSAGAASVLVWNATPWGDAIRAANAIPLLFSSYVDSSFTYE